LDPIFKYFTEEDHARAFINKGQMLFRTLAYFRALEFDEERGDPNDGELNFRPDNGLQLTKEDGSVVAMPGWRFVSSGSPSDMFVFCASTELSEKIAKKLGPFCVEIFDPVFLVAKLRARLRIRSQFDARNVYFKTVDYRDLNAEPKADWALPERMAFIKPKEFEDQQEFRFVIGKKRVFDVQNVEIKLQKGDAILDVNETDSAPFFLNLGQLNDKGRIHRFD